MIDKKALDEALKCGCDEAQRHFNHEETLELIRLARLGLLYEDYNQSLQRVKDCHDQRYSG